MLWMPVMLLRGGAFPATTTAPLRHMVCCLGVCFGFWWSSLSLSLCVCVCVCFPPSALSGCGCLHECGCVAPSTYAHGPAGVGTHASRKETSLAVVHVCIRVSLSHCVCVCVQVAALSSKAGRAAGGGKKGTVSSSSAAEEVSNNSAKNGQGGDSRTYRKLGKTVCVCTTCPPCWCLSLLFLCHCTSLLCVSLRLSVTRVVSSSHTRHLLLCGHGSGLLAPCIPFQCV